MDLTEPARMVMAPSTAAVLRVLAGADALFTGRQLARLAGISHNQAARVIERLSEHGLVIVEPFGSANRIQLNRDHLAADAVIQLTRLRARLVELARTEIAGWQLPPRHASLFGSAARGDGTTTSDLDILVIREEDIAAGDPQWTDQLYQCADRLRAASGNAVSWFELTLNDLERAVHAGEAIIHDWKEDGVTLYGDTARNVLKAIR